MCSDDIVSSADLEASDLAPMEQEWLHLVRLHCVSFEHNRADGWDKAMSHAESRFGADNGPLIAARIAAVIRAMRSERQGGFGYLSPFCPSCRLRVTMDEWHLIALLQSGYRGERAEIANAAASFARGDTAPSLAAAALRFGSTVAAAFGVHRTALASNLVLH